MHPRNRHQGHYDFEQLIQGCPDLAPFVSTNSRSRELSIDFADPEAVRALNRALLQHFYGIARWDIPANCLCPPVPGRADYVHGLADLLAGPGAVPRGDSIRVLDIGVGAGCIYPVIGHCEYGWRFVGTDIDPTALASAERIVSENEKQLGGIELRHQPKAANLFTGVVLPQERFDLSLCNPPFHASPAEAQAGSLRKWRNLGRAPRSNFGGQGAELWCPGGEAAFIGRMIEESAKFQKQVLWFSTLVSKEPNLPGIDRALKKAGVAESRAIDMAQGQKKSRFVAWTFADQSSREKWKS